MTEPLPPLEPPLQNLAEEMAKIPDEPLLLVEKQLIVGSLLLGVILLGVLLWISYTFF